MKHQLTKKVEKELKEIAERLPATFSEANEYKMGSMLLKIDPNMKDNKGRRIDKDTRYGPIKVKVPDNHFRRLKNAWIENGHEGVQAYCDKVGQKIKK